MINICIFEDEGYKFSEPLTSTRPVYDLLVGIDTPLDKIKRYFDYGNISLHCRPSLKALVKNKHPKLSVNQINTGAPGLFINGRVIMNYSLAKTLLNLSQSKDYILTHEGELIAAYLQKENLAYMADLLKAVPNAQNLIQYFRNKCVAKEIKKVDLISSMLNLIVFNSAALHQDFKFKNVPGIIKGTTHPFTNIYHEDNVFIDKNAVLEDAVVIQAENGPVYIEEHVYIESGSRIEGPAFIGAHSQIKGARIRSSSIGKHCKVGGEVSMSVLSDYSNKAHDGFLGHSYIGEWVNLGAGSTTSNLKNTYGTIKTTIDGNEIDTQLQFLGAIIADHVKCGIGTLLNAGTVIGLGANLFGSAIHDKVIPAFTWGERGQYRPLKKEKFFEIVSRVKSRRKQSLLDAEKDLFSLIADA